MEQLLGEDIRKQVMDALAEMDAPVEMVLVADEPDTQADALLQEVAATTDKLGVQRLSKEAAAAEGMRTELTPAIFLRRHGDAAASFYFLGTPSGYEFGTLIEDILDVSRGRTSLSDQTREFLDGLEEPLRLQVFSTPTCPYCPRAVRLAHQMAMESGHVEAQGIDAASFMELAMQHEVRAVPRTVINGEFALEGAVPEAVLVKKIREALATAT